jgi:hypothetical protein
VLRSLGLRSVVDLRSAQELARTGRGPLAFEPVEWVRLPVLAEEGTESVAAPAPTSDDLALRYLWYLDVGASAFVGALSRMSRPERRPLVFHCAAGKDRTGVLAALLLDGLGVEPTSVADDYELTALGLGQIIDRLRSDPDLAPRLREVPAAQLGIRRSTMERFLVLLYDRYGGSVEWSRRAGLAHGTWDRLRAGLLEPEEAAAADRTDGDGPVGGRDRSG